jgi:hypothetical protein
MIILDITADPEKLERAIARIDGPGETFQNVKKLEIAVEELAKELRDGEYDYFSVVADLLIETQEQMSHFDAYVALPHISLIRRKIVAIESELRRQVQWIFREIGPLASSESYGADSIGTDKEPLLDLSALSKIDLVVDALGDVFRRDLLGRFAQLQLIPYEKLFKHGTKYAGLDCLDQRFAWFKYLLSIVDAKFSGIFPAGWVVPSHLFTEFCRRTKKHLGDVLAQIEKENPDPSTHVTVLLKALKSVVAFEAEITASFCARERVESGEESSYELPESITDAFDPYLGPYVQMERQGLEELMEGVLSAESAVEGMQPGDPYESSRKMFEYIKGSLKRCTGFSTGITFLSLSKEFRICLQQYAESLKFRCPTPTFAQGYKSDKRPIYVLTKSIEVTLCRIIRTGEYCVDTVPALETMMKARIKPVYQNDVDFSAQIDSFNDLVSFAMGVLASGEVNRMEDSFKEMRKVSWGTLDTVGDVSLHIKKFLKILSDCVPRIRLTMTSVYFSNICIKLATAFLDNFLDSLMQLKRICMTGGGQLLLDLNGLKEYLLKMPNVRLPEGAEPVVISKVYLSVVNAKIKKIEVILKLVCTEDSRMEEMFSLLWPEGTTADLESVNALKGSGRNILPLPLDQGLGAMKDGSRVVKDGVLGVGKDMKTGVVKGVGGIKNAFGEMIHGNMFSDNSSHSGDDHRYSASTGNGNTNSNTRPASTTNTASSTANKAATDLKNAFGGAMAFMKAGASAATAPPTPTTAPRPAANNGAPRTATANNGVPRK